MLNQYQPAEDGPGSGFHSRLFSGLIVIGAVNIIGVLRDLVPMYSRNGFLRSPLGAAKTSLKRQVVCERGSLRQAHAKSTLSSPQNRSGRHFLNSRNALAAVYTDILHLC